MVDKGTPGIENRSTHAGRSDASRQWGEGSESQSRYPGQEVKSAGCGVKETGWFASVRRNVHEAFRDRAGFNWFRPVGTLIRRRCCQGTAPAK